MAERNLISIGEIAGNHGLRRQSVHKIVKWHGIEPVKVNKGRQCSGPKGVLHHYRRLRITRTAPDQSTAK